MTWPQVVYDPDTYVDGVPFETLARLRHESPVVWVDETPGPGFWLVLRHADVESVLTRPRLFSSWLGATQIRDPATPEALAYVRRMMLNTDPPEHARLRRLLSRSFTPRAVGLLAERIQAHARSICDRALAGSGGSAGSPGSAGSAGECDFAKDLAADLPLLTLAKRHNYLWLQDFLDDEICVTPDLYEVLRAFRQQRKPSA